MSPCLLYFLARIIQEIDIFQGECISFGNPVKMINQKELFAMKTISMEVWELDALAHNEKTCKRTPLRLQPTKDASGMWHWKDYQWMDGGLGFPQSGVEDHLFYQPGDIVGVQNSAFRIRIKSVRVEQLWEITDAAAQKEGCRGIFSGSGEVMGSGWDVLPREEYEKQWNRNVFPLSYYGWNANPWVRVIEFERIGKDETMDVDGCKYCHNASRLSFRCDVRVLGDNGFTEDVPVPVLRCPYCGRLLKISRE